MLVLGRQNVKKDPGNVTATDSSNSWGRSDFWSLHSHPPSYDVQPWVHYKRAESFRIKCRALGTAVRFSI